MNMVSPWYLFENGAARLGCAVVSQFCAVNQWLHGHMCWSSKSRVSEVAVYDQRVHVVCASDHYALLAVVMHDELSPINMDKVVKPGCSVCRIVKRGSWDACRIIKPGCGTCWNIKPGWHCDKCWIIKGCHTPQQQGWLSFVCHHCGYTAEIRKASCWNHAECSQRRSNVWMVNSYRFGYPWLYSNSRAYHTRTQTDT
jgi:hypothetical protein